MYFYDFLKRSSEIYLLARTVEPRNDGSLAHFDCKRRIFIIAYLKSQEKKKE